MPKSGETRTVKAIKEANAKAKAKRTAAPHTQPPQVANEQASQVANAAVDNSLHTQPDRQPPEVAPTEENVGIEIGKSKSINTTIGVLCNLSEEQRAEIANAGVSDAELADSLETLLPLFAAEGLTPSSRVLADAVLQLHRDAR